MVSGQSLEASRVLFVGNSQVNCVCDIAEIVEQLSRSAPTHVRRIDTDEVVIGGATLERLWNDGTAREKIAADRWDWAVFNELIYSYGGNTRAFREYAREFDRVVKDVGARIMFFATGEIETAKLLPGAMYRDALALARKCDGRVAGAGMAWLKAWEEQPDMDLHHTDRAHPNAAGYYLNACVIYAALTNATPVGLDPFTLCAEEAAFLQGIAWQQYQEDRLQERQA